MFKKNYLSLILLIVLFIVPGIAAYIVYTHPTLLGDNSTNHGKFVKPPLLIKELPKGKKWYLAYYAKDKCMVECMGNLDKLARIRLALGRHLYDVDGYLFLSSNAQELSIEQEKLLHDINIFVLKFAEENSDYQNLFKENAYFIVNPDGYVVLAFNPSSLSEDIFQDLKKLVNN